MADESSKNLKYYIPKKDTQQEKFLTKYPEYDGRGLLIAIIDDGCADVSLPGMQKTSTGLPKIYDFFDFTGNANIDTSTVKKCNEKNILIGLSGRELKIPSKWINPTGKWHLGNKSFYDLCFGNDQENKNNKNYALSKNTVLDCIVWYDGEKWQACCDTSFKGDLENLKVLTNYSDEHEFSFLMEDISYCIKIGDNGNLLQIFVPNHDHGIIVSQVAAANFPKEPEKNGLAPGAQIVSMNIGLSDPIIPMNEALLKCSEMRVDIINLSITVHEIHETLIKKMIEEDGIIFVIHGGNDGPSYSSAVKNQQIYYDKMFFIGALLTSEMKTLFYNVKENNVNSPPTVCLYSSRGPWNNDGSRGITFSAPGGVIISLPKWKPIEYRRCLGTSVSTPIAAGSIACLLSALKANSIKYSPENIKLALSNTAYLPEDGDRLGFGNGILQIDSAFEYYQTVLINSPVKRLINLSIGWLNKKYGIFFIEKETWETIKEYSVNLDISNEENHSSWKLKLIPENAERWIQHSHTVTNNSFNVKIDTNQLKLGSFNYAEIHGCDSANPLNGSLFHLPITIIYPEELTRDNNFTVQKEIILESRIPYRFYFIPPEYFQQCFVKITSMENMSTELYVSYGYTGESKIFNFISKGQTENYAFKVNWRKICEINICHSNLLNGETSQNSYKFIIEIEFNVFFKMVDTSYQKSADDECKEKQKTASSSFLLV